MRATTGSDDFAIEKSRLRSKVEEELAIAEEAQRAKLNSVLALVISVLAMVVSLAGAAVSWSLLRHHHG
jgi:hypothetical protein